MDESIGGMLKLTGPNYSIWKSKVRDFLLCKHLWLSVQRGLTKQENVDASTLEIMHLKLIATYIQCFVDMSSYNNFDDETKVDVWWC